MQEPVVEEAGAQLAHVARFGPWGRLLLLASKWLAIAGGLVFVGLVVMSIVYAATVLMAHRLFTCAEKT